MDVLLSFFPSQLLPADFTLRFLPDESLNLTCVRSISSQSALDAVIEAQSLLFAFPTLCSGSCYWRCVEFIVSDPLNQYSQPQARVVNPTVQQQARYA
jgi:hypothetical protein